MDSRLSMENQVVQLKKRCFHTIRNICKIRFLLSEDQLKIVVNSLVVSCLDYCNSLYFGITEKLLYQLQLIQNASAKVITRKYKHDHIGNDLKDLHWLDVRKRVLFKIALLVFKSLNGLAPVYLQELICYKPHGHSLKLMVPEANSKLGTRSFSNIGPRIYNKLPSSVTESENIAQFKNSLKTYLFNMSLTDLDRLIN